MTASTKGTKDNIFQIFQIFQKKAKKVQKTSSKYLQNLPNPQTKEIAQRIVTGKICMLQNIHCEKIENPLKL